MKKETLEKIKRTRAENEVKLFEVRGYEVWRDSRNLITKKGNRQHYHMSLVGLLQWIVYQESDKKIKDVQLENLVKELTERDNRMIMEIKGVFSKLQPKNLSLITKEDVR